MARINIEDSLFKNPNFLKLIAKKGNYYEALGIVVSSFILAQKYWLKFRSIPIEKWDSDYEILIECGLAERSIDGRSVVVKGSNEQFAWLEQRSKAGQSNSSAKTNSLKQYAQNDRTDAERTPNGRTTETEPLSSSLSSLNSNLLSQGQVPDFKNHSSTENFNSRFNPKNEEFFNVLDKYNWRKRFSKHIGAIINTFEMPIDLENFIDTKSQGKTILEINDSQEKEDIKKSRINEYLITCLKKEIGAK